MEPRFKQSQNGAAEEMSEVTEVSEPSGNGGGWESRGEGRAWGGTTNTRGL